MRKLNENCGCCGMPVDVRAYHPMSACFMFEKTRSSAAVSAHLRQAVEYGMKAQARGVDLDAALADISNVLSPEANR